MPRPLRTAEVLLVVRIRRVLGVGAAAALASVGALVVSASPAGALTSFTVDKAGDTVAPNAANCPGIPAGTCTLRDAFAAANATAGDVQINVPASLSPIILTTGNVLSYTVVHALTLTGTGGQAAITQKAGATQGVISAPGPNPNLFTIQNLTISGGNNTAGFGGGGIDADFTPLTLVNSTVSNNKAAGVGGGILNEQLLTLTNSTVSNNSAGGGGGIAGPALHLMNSTVSGNTASGGAGGLDLSSGNLVNSTISTNTGTVGGIESTLPVTLSYTTVVDNTGSTAANVNATLSSFGSIIALAHGPNCVLSGATTSFGYNLEDDPGASCGFSTTTADPPPGTPPNVGALANNGGPTLTRVPLNGSPLIDAIPNGTCQKSPLAGGITADQRALARPSPSGGACDIGAVEVQVAAAAPVVITPRFTG